MKTNALLALAFLALLSVASAAPNGHQVAEWLVRVKNVDPGEWIASVPYADTTLVRWPFAFSVPSDGEVTNPVAASLWFDGWQSAPVEVPRVAYTNGWSETIEPDGSTLVWKHRNSPFDPATDEAARAKARQTNAALRAEIRALRLQIATNIADTAALIATGTNAIAELQALTFSTTPTKAQVTALRNEVVDATRILNDSLRELKDANQAMQDVRRVLGALYKEE